MIPINMKTKDFSEWFIIFRDSVIFKSIGEDNNGRIVMLESMLMNRGAVYYTDNKFYVLETNEEFEEFIDQASANGISADYDKFRYIASHKLK